MTFIKSKMTPLLHAELDYFDQKYQKLSWFWKQFFNLLAPDLTKCFPIVNCVDTGVAFYSAYKNIRFPRLFKLLFRFMKSFETTGIAQLGQLFQNDSNRFKNALADPAFVKGGSKQRLLLEILKKYPTPSTSQIQSISWLLDCSNTLIHHGEITNSFQLSLAYIDHPSQMKVVTRWLKEFGNYGISVCFDLLKIIPDFTRFIETWDHLSAQNLLSIGYVKAFANDPDFVNQLESAKSRLLPTGYETKLIDANNVYHAPSFQRNGVVVWVNRVGYADFSFLPNRGIYIDEMANASEKNEEDLPKWRQVGRSLHEYIFRESCVLPGVQGRIELQAAFGSELFHYRCGFRVLPKFDVCHRHCILETIHSEEPHHHLFSILEDFWKKIAMDAESKIISIALKEAIQWLLDNVTLIAKLNQGCDLKRKQAYDTIISALQHRDIKRLIQTLFPSENLQIKNILQQMDKRKAQVNRGAFEMFLPYSSIIANGKRYHIPHMTSFQPDENSKLYAAMYETEYQVYMTPPIDNQIRALLNCLHPSSTSQRGVRMDVSFTTQEGLFAEKRTVSNEHSPCKIFSNKVFSPLVFVQP